MLLGCGVLLKMKIVRRKETLLMLLRISRNAEQERRGQQGQFRLKFARLQHECYSELNSIVLRKKRKVSFNQHGVGEFDLKLVYWKLLVL